MKKCSAQDQSQVDLNFSKVVHPAITLNDESQKLLSVTAYNNNIGHIHDVRSINSRDSGHTVIEFQNVSPRINSRSALLEGVDRVVEQNFDSDILSIETLLKHHIGKCVRVSKLPFFDLHEQTVTILNVTDSNAIIQTENGNIISIPLNDRDMISRFGFSSIPETLRVKPTLSMLVEGRIQAKVSLSYLTSGISWSTDYVASVSDGTLDLNAWVTLKNKTGIAFNDANIRLVSGSVNAEIPDRERLSSIRSMRHDLLALDMKADDVADYKLYRVPFKVDLLHNQEKQISLFTASKVPITKEYSVSLNINSTSFKGSRPDVTVVMKNKKEYNLGIPMPAGTIRFYEKNSGERFFIGESRTDDVAVNDLIHSTIGKAFDITIDGRMTDLNIEKSEGSGTSTLEYTLNNASGDLKVIQLNVRGKPSIRVLAITQGGIPVSDQIISIHRQGTSHLEISVKLQPQERKKLIVEYAFLISS